MTPTTNTLATALGLNEPQQLRLANIVFTLRPMTLGTLAALFPLLETLATKGVEVPAEGSAPELAAFLRGGPEALQFLALASGLAPEDVGGLSFSDAEALLKGIWEVNADFFRRSATAIAALDTRIMRQMAKMIGVLSSKSSLAADTNLPTSDFIPGDSAPDFSAL